MQLPEIVKAKLEQQSQLNLTNPSDKDIISLAGQIYEKAEAKLGINTLKRLLGTIDDNHVQARQSTLNAIAKYLGSDNWPLLLINLSHGSSSFDRVEGELLSADLTVGQVVKVTYLPNRELSFSYLGEEQYEVIESLNSKLQQGDIVTISSFVEHYPLIVRRVVRHDKDLGSYSAARAAGLATISLL